MNNIEPLSSLNNITDGDILTYSQAQDTTTYIAYDLMNAALIGRIVFLPRNDDNYIWPGYNYELFYQNGVNGWKSLGVQSAINRTLKYLIPQNSLLWLRDRTKGEKSKYSFIKMKNKYSLLICRYFNVNTSFSYNSKFTVCISE